MKALKVTAALCGSTAIASALLFTGQAQAAVLAADDFNRADGATLGATPVGGYSWVETGENNSAQATVTGNKGQLLSRAQGVDLRASLAGLSIKDVDITVTYSPVATPSSTNYMGGVQWRMPTTAGALASVPGYSITFSEDAWGGPIQAGRIQLGSFGDYVTGEFYDHPGGFVPGTDYVVRVVADDDNHKVYLNGNLVIDYTDPNAAHNVAGFVGLASYYGDYTYDDFSVSDLNPIPEPASVGMLAAGGALMFARGARTRRVS